LRLGWLFVATDHCGGKRRAVVALIIGWVMPAALPLFATGLGGLGLLSWRRKRKAQAVA
jgi:hypothetical protein